MVEKLVELVLNSSFRVKYLVVKPLGLYSLSRVFYAL
jgi:hypothetical protein